MRAAYSRKIKKWKEARRVGNSHIANHNSIDMCSIKVTNGRDDSRKRRNSATPISLVGYGNTVAFQQERSMIPIDT